MANRERPNSKTVHAFPDSASIASLRQAVEQAESLAVSRPGEPVGKLPTNSVFVSTIFVPRQLSLVSSGSWFNISGSASAGCS